VAEAVVGVAEKSRRRRRRRRLRKQTEAPR
jgi:hypothetical protein